MNDAPTITNKLNAEDFANKLNAHLSAGGRVQVTTYTRSTIYSPKHSGMFHARNNTLYVKHGKSSLALSSAGMLLVGIRSL